MLQPMWRACIQAVINSTQPHKDCKVHQDWRGHGCNIEQILKCLIASKSEVETVDLHICTMLGKETCMLPGQGKLCKDGMAAQICRLCC